MRSPVRECGVDAAVAAFRSVFKVTASYSGSSRRSSEARLVCILRLGKFLLLHCGFNLSGENAFDGGRCDFLVDALLAEPAIEG